MANIPKIKKKVKAFLTKEDGKISKDKLVKTGVLMTTITILTAASVESVCPPISSGTHDDHCNSLSVEYSAQNGAKGTHSHGYHGSHDSGHADGCSIHASGW